MHKRLFCVLLVLIVGPSAHAWSYKEHVQLTRMAAERIVADPAAPDALKQWLKECLPGMKDMAGEKDFYLHKRVGLDISPFKGLERWAVMPDRHALNDPEGEKVA